MPSIKKIIECFLVVGEDSIRIWFECMIFTWIPSIILGTHQNATSRLANVVFPRLQVLKNRDFY